MKTMLVILWGGLTVAGMDKLIPPQSRVKPEWEISYAYRIENVDSLRRHVLCSPGKPWSRIFSSSPTKSFDVIPRSAIHSDSFFLAATQVDSEAVNRFLRVPFASRHRRAMELDAALYQHWHRFYDTSAAYVFPFPLAVEQSATADTFLYTKFFEAVFVLHLDDEKMMNPRVTAIETWDGQTGILDTVAVAVRYESGRWIDADGRTYADLPALYHDVLDRDAKTGSIRFLPYVSMALLLILIAVVRMWMKKKRANQP